MGIHDGHNAAACLISNGHVTHLVQEERFTGVKNQGGFPTRSVRWILSDAGLAADQLNCLALGQWQKVQGHDRHQIVESYRREALHAPFLRYGWRRFRSGVLKRTGLYESLKKRFDQQRFSASYEALPGLTPGRITAFDHHTCHAASAYYGSPFAGEEALVLTQDGSGDGACATVSIGRDGALERMCTTPAGHSLGDIYARITHLMGMVPLEHEYKLMGLAPYADLARAEEVCSVLEGLLVVDGLRFRRTTLKQTQFLGGRLLRELQFLRFDCIAAGLQMFFERRITEWVRNAVSETGIGRLCLSGGSFMNVKANKLIAEMPEVDEVFVCPSCGDESLALGAAQLAHLHSDPSAGLPEPLGSLYLGSPVDDLEAGGLVEKLDGVAVEEPQDLPARVAALLAEGEIVARCCGRTEFGARALGNRSIIADPSRPLTVRVLNQMIKMRDFWMPFAPVLRASKQEGYLVNPKGRRSPYMMSAFDTCPDKYSDIACAVQPADRTVRPQLLEDGWNPEVEALLTEFEALTGRPVLLNTSYNIHGEPMVGTATQAIDVFLRSGLRWLWLGDRLLHKTGEPVDGVGAG